MNTHFISCDWGTSNLRMRLVERSTLNVLAEYSSAQGIARTYEDWKKSSEDRTAYYSKTLSKGIPQLVKNKGIGDEAMPIVCSGMASSTLGLLELPYSTLPFPLDGTKAVVEQIVSPALPKYPFFLISGVKKDHDLMRGEETELVGIADVVDAIPEYYLAIIPGTHSKHIVVRDGHITDFHTYMTGEVFSLLHTHSTLRHSLESAAQTNTKSFILGVEDSGKAVLTSAFFKVRSRHLLGEISKTDNYAYLSGLLIGSELGAIDSATEMPILVYGPPAISTLYTEGLKGLGLSDRLLKLPLNIYEKALISGQMNIYSKFKKDI